MFLYKSIHLKYNDPNNIITKKNYPYIKTYNNKLKYKTFNKLNTIKYNFKTLHIKYLTIKKKILKPNNPNIPHPIIFRKTIYTNNKQFNRYITL